MSKKHLPTKSQLGNLGPNHGAVAQRTDWATPQPLFDRLNKEFDFTLDPCASDKTAKCEKYYTFEDDGLSKSWANERVFMNPPYGREIASWIEKANHETFNDCILVVGLLPVRACTKWFHDYILHNAEIRFIKGRVKFVGGQGAPFASMIVIWRNKEVSNSTHSTFNPDFKTQRTLEEFEKEK